MPDGSYHFTTHAIRTLDLSWLEAQLVRHHGFEPERARRVIEHYRCVLEIAADQPHRRSAPVEVEASPQFLSRCDHAPLTA